MKEKKVIEPDHLFAETFALQVPITEDKVADVPQLSGQQLLAHLNAAYADGSTDDEREHLRQMTASHRRLIESEPF